MKKMIKYSVPLAMFLLVMAGCASRKPKMAINPGPAQAVVQVVPPQGRVEPRVAPVSDRALPVYSNPIIEEVESSPYINDLGDMVFPGKMLVIRTPGHWNLDAAKKNNQYYVPADNMPPQLAPPSKSYYDYIQSKKNGVIPAKQLDVSAVRVTGFTQKEEETQAKAALQPGETLAFDLFLGWIAVNNASLQSTSPGSDALGKAQAPNETQVKAALDGTMTAFGAAASGAANSPPAAPTPQPSTALPGDNAQGGSREEEVKKIIDDAFKEGQKIPPAAAPKQNP